MPYTPIDCLSEITLTIEIKMEHDNCGCHYTWTGGEMGILEGVRGTLFADRLERTFFLALGKPHIAERQSD